MSERPRDNYNVVTEDGDVVSFHDADGIELGGIAHLDSDLEIDSPSSIEKSIRAHPSARDMDEFEISKLARELIEELRQRPKNRRKAPAITAVLRNLPHLSPEDRSAIAVQAGMRADTFEGQHDREVTRRGTADLEDESVEDRPVFIDGASAAANDRL